MNHDLSFEEEEHIDQLKTFWKKYGDLLTGIVLALAASAVGWQWWQHRQQQEALQAASLYATLQGMQQVQQISAVNSLADTLIQRYPNSPYTSRGALIAAATDGSNLAQTPAQSAAQVATAKKDLQWILDHSKENSIKNLARLHLAALLLDQHQAKEALDLLNVDHDKQATDSYADLYNDLSGDIFLSLGNRQSAISAWQAALSELPASSPYRQVVEIKLNAIAGTVKP